MKVGWDVTRNLIVVKTEDVEVPNEIRESCRDDAKGKHVENITQG